MNEKRTISPIQDIHERHIPYGGNGHASPPFTNPHELIKKSGSNCLRSDYSVWTHSVAGGEYSWSGSWGADSTRRSKSLVRVLLGCKECVIGLSLFAWARVSAGECVCVFCVRTLTRLNKREHYTGTVFWWKHTTHTKGRAFLDKKTKQNWRLDI